MDCKTILEAVREWIITLSTSAALVAAIYAGSASLKEYRLKARAEKRLAQSSEIESDIRLIKLFIEIMDLAHARRESQISEKAIEALLSPELAKQIGLSVTNIQEILGKTVITLPVGSAAQDAAISAIWALGNKHEILKPIAIQALTSLNTFRKEVADNYLQDLISKYDGKVLAGIDSSTLQAKPDSSKAVN
jgi:hypothetical protein